MAISDNIKEIRKLYGLTQSELGKIAGVTDKAVSSWENGKKEPRMGSIQKIADHLNLSKSNIIEEAGMKYALAQKDGHVLSDTKFTYDLSSTQGKINKAISELNQEGKEKVLEYARDLQGTGRYKKFDKSGVG